ncbi:MULTISPECIES: hypothetical protein [Streptomycetaceae]|uniref:Uncharacterized protein n=1 Tax=Streptantibioticus cattleyicolor (strain ATCC 35852 / DSM 46488 / JCM 4925 / NBRC 14057 / NRRL 8057) TaxID=1003195 RepID=F8K2U6_STREN|nr:hypothetical protein [Streptantibioticus cattleyicolor]AEW95561.1 hypothetical protein SCATT_31900 [Streptantibioticus cattleyicolor NRRL 8057 = DSM 46488]MYS60112.1 hypothetical protein [Streptomyces sp. SID5468]CCB75898.1 conserved protein of unknown function [Streptantibioticus cattleyicolor NRRL 8057 = DSM 46488]
MAAEYAREVEVTHDIGADRSGRRLSAGAFAVTDPDGSLPHEAFCELGGSPRVSVELFSEGDALITVEGVPFHDVPWDSVPAFLSVLYRGLAHVKVGFWPPRQQLVVPLPGDETYKETIFGPLNRWLGSRIR